MQNGRMNTPEFDMMGFGEVLLRLTPSGRGRILGAEHFEREIGGAELNVAAGLAMLGLRTALMTRLPDSPIGQFARNRIRFTGVSDDWVQFDSTADARLGLYFYEHGESPRKPMVIYDRKGSSFSKFLIEDLDPSPIGRARLLHLTGITLGLGSEMRAQALHLVRAFHEAGGIVSFDVNYRAALWSESEARECLKEILPLSHILFVSEETARRLLERTGDLQSIQRSFAEEFGCDFVATTRRTVESPTRHSWDSLVYDAKSDRFHSEEPYRSIEVVDRIGSGDAFVAGALYGLLAGNGAADAVSYGNALAAIKCTLHGDMVLSSRAEILSVIRQHQASGQGDEMSR